MMINKYGNFRTTIRNEILSTVYRIPPLYLLTARLKHQSAQDSIVRPDTEIVFGGFPRSANSFALNAFRFAQSQPVKIAHHIHSAGQIFAAMYYHIPAVVLIRHPKDAIVSLALRNPRISIPVAFNNYFLFYRTLLGKSGYVVAEFDSVIGDFGAVIARVNERFRTAFTPFSSTEENVRKVFDMIENRHKQIIHGQSVNEMMVARPSEAKKQAKPHVEKILDMEYPDQLKDATELWQEFCSLAS